MTKRHSRSRRSKETPGWMWMLLGLTMGLVFAGYIYLSDVRAPSSAPQARTSEATPETSAEPNKPAPRQPSPAPARTPAAAQTTAAQTATARSSSAPSSTAQASTAQAAATQTSTRQTSAPPSSTAQTRAEPTAAEPQPATQTAAARFQFYENLPQSEVVVPEPAASSARPSATSTTAAQTAAQTAARAPAPTPIQEPGSYLLQVGSFRTHADADRRKASIALLGYESQIQQAIVNGDLVHRVLVGPITDMAALDVARRRFREQNFDTLVLTAK